MASFTPDLDQLHELYRQYGADLFALCYLQAGRPAQALDLMAASLCDMAASPKLWELAASGKEGFLRVGHLNCVDASLRRPKRPKRKKDASGQEAPRPALPFSLTDPLREILKLRLPARTALFCRERLNLSWEAAAAAGHLPARCQRLYGAALKQAKITAGQARANLETLSPGEDTLDAAWEEFLSQRGQAGFSTRQRYRRARRAMDVAMPFLALGVVAICVVAFLGVEHGWFGPSSVPVQGTAQESSSDDLPLEVGDVSVYVPEEGGFAEYIVHNTPYSPEDILRQMVYLGGAPAGTTLLSANLDSGGTESSDGSTVTYTLGDTLSLTLEFSQEAASLSGEEGERTLQAMAATFAAYTQGLDRLSFRCQGEELTVNGKTAQDFLDGQLTITRTVETDYRE
ncbi:MAG: hypothetical protein ACLRWC_10655 [Acutalibacter sp.]